MGPCSEDCLYLNVFSPSLTQENSKKVDETEKLEKLKVPVMVFVHGGSFAADSAIKYGDLGICRTLVNFI